MANERMDFLPSVLEEAGDCGPGEFVRGPRGKVSGSLQAALEGEAGERRVCGGRSGRRRRSEGEKGER